MSFSIEIRNSMKTFLTVTLILFTLLNSYSQEKKPFTIYEYLKLKKVVESTLSPDGKQLAFSINVNREMKDGKGNDYRELYLRDMDSGEIRSILTGKNYFSSIQWTSDSKQIGCISKFNNILKNQVFLIDIETGSHKQLTEIPEGINQYVLHPGGNGIAFTSIPKEAAKDDYKAIGFDAEVFEEDIIDIKLYYQNNGITKVLNSSGSVFDFQWSPDGKMIAAQIAPLNLVDHKYMYKKIYFIDMDTGVITLGADTPGKLSQMSWSPNGKQLAFIAGVDSSDPVSGSLFSINVPNEKPWEEIQNHTINFEGSVTNVIWKDNKTMIFSAEESVDVTINELKQGDDSWKKISTEPGIIFKKFNIHENQLVMVANTSAHPDEAYLFDLREYQFQRLTNLNPWLENYSLAQQEKISYEARDGLIIEGVLQYPIGYQPGNRYPLICVIHGGPESCMSNGWVTSYSKWGNIAANQGYFVFMPNYRASSGRGVAYSKMDQMDLGDEEFLDVIDGIEYLSDKGFIDKSKVGIGGGSYGGYFSALAATKYSDHFAVAIPFVGVTNQLSKVNLTDIPNEIYQVHWKIWPNENPELYYDRSPVKYSSNNKTATLILHGKEDTRVHPSQSLELYRQLKLHGKAPVRLVWYPGEGHGNKNKQAQLDFNLRTMRWYNYYLKGEGDPQELPEKEINYQLEKLGDTNLDTKSSP